MKGWILLSVTSVWAFVSWGCAPIEYSVIIVEASQAIAAAEVAGASCTPEQLDRLSPVTKNLAPDPGTALVSTEEEPLFAEMGQPMCDAPFEYYSALEFQHKAREEVGYSDYESAIEFARQARTYAQKARDIALNRNQERGADMLSRSFDIRMISLFALFFLGGGCAETAKLRGGIATTHKQLEQIERNGAYVCAPRELALAKAHLRFAELEIEQGMSTRAQKHFEIAARNTELADEKSPADQCAGPAVVVAECVDTDGDGVCDDLDRCPSEPEDFDGVDDTDGCPEDQDLDGDTIMDSIDQCILDPEDTDGYLDEDGCPEPDNDLDTILDTADRCINEPEDPDGFEDTDGCPDPDNDKDSVPDLTDECPNVAGEVSNNGCPKKYEGVEITETHIRINQKIHFAYNKAKIKKTSFWILNQVVKVLGDYPEITLSVEGHTDSRGSDRYNKKLSTRRAKAVMNYLVRKGRISRSRLVSRGFGEARPIDTNLSNEGRAANRRVEFVRTDVPSKE